MKKVTIYTKRSCGFCTKALLVLKRHGVNPQVIDVGKNPGRKPEMVKRAGGRTTVPQIFFGDEHIGGCDNLLKLQANNQLKERLKDV
jgi:glutaredoxin 3